MSDKEFDYNDLDEMHDARGLSVVVGDLVETNELKLGRVESIGYDGWAVVRYDDGTRALQNDARILKKSKSRGVKSLADQILEKHGPGPDRSWCRKEVTLERGL